MTEPHLIRLFKEALYSHGGDRTPLVQASLRSQGLERMGTCHLADCVLDLTDIAILYGRWFRRFARLRKRQNSVRQGGQIESQRLLQRDLPDGSTGGITGAGFHAKSLTILSKRLNSAYSISKRLSRRRGRKTHVFCGTQPLTVFLHAS